MDNCGGHELTVTLDRGLIATAKIRCLSKLISAVLHVIDMKRNTNHSFKERSMNGNWGLQDGLLPHVGDAIMLFDSTWGVMSH